RERHRTRSHAARGRDRRARQRRQGWRARAASARAHSPSPDRFAGADHGSRRYPPAHLTARPPVLSAWGNLWTTLWFSLEERADSPDLGRISPSGTAVTGRSSPARRGPISGERARFRLIP